MMFKESVVLMALVASASAFAPTPIGKSTGEVRVISII